MTQTIKRNGETYKFPDDASIDEINKFLGQRQEDSLISSVKSVLPTMPHGINVATGLFSLAFPGERGEAVKYLPQIMSGEQPGAQAKTEAFAGTMLPGLEGGGPEAVKSGYKGVQKGLEYINPEKATEQFRNMFGEGNVAENIENIGKRFKFAKESAKEEALVPKREFMEEAKGKRIKNEYAETPYPVSETVEQADRRMSDLKEKIRKLEPFEKKGTIGDASSNELDRARKELEKLKLDWSEFIQKLPEKARGKYYEFTKKYAINVGEPYENASFVIRKMANGDFKDVRPETLDRIFSNPNPKEGVLKVIKDIGPSGWNNLVHNMLSKYEPGQAISMANAILSGARKGSKIITPEMEKAAKKLIMRYSIGEAVKSSAGGIVGGILGGPIGGAIGAAAPVAWSHRDLLTRALQRFRR